MVCDESSSYHFNNRHAHADHEYDWSKSGGTKMHCGGNSGGIPEHLENNESWSLGITSRNSNQMASTRKLATERDILIAKLIGCQCRDLDTNVAFA